MSSFYLAQGLPQPVPAVDGLDAEFWQGLSHEKILLQHCCGCSRWQWGPEWICHRCHSEDLEFSDVPGAALIYSYERVWHPVHPALKEQGAYLVVLVEFPAADNVRLVGNLLGDAHQEVTIGSKVRPVFEHHKDSDPAFTLLQWQVSA